MNIGNGFLNTIPKEIKKSKSIKSFMSKNNIKRNLKIMNDPAFHLNKTLKEYIAQKLKKNTSTEKMLKDNKNINEIKMKNGIMNIIPEMSKGYNYFNRIKTLSNILHQSKSKKDCKKRKIKIKNVNSKSNKKKGNNKNKINLNLFNFHNKRNDSKIKENINQKINTLPNNSKNQEFFRYSGSDINNHFLERRVNIYSSINQYMPNNTTLELNSLKSPLTQNIKKENKFIKQYNNNSGNILSNGRYYNLDNVKIDNSNNIKTEINNTLFPIDNNNYNNTYYSDNINKNSFKCSKSNSVIIINANINNKSDNTIKFTNIKDSQENPIDKNSIIILNNDMKEYYNTMGNNNENNNHENINKNSNSIEYLKKIEMLENENKLLKGEISESKNRLIMLEKKIGQLLGEKNLVLTEKEECPQPMPYVKKYSAQTCMNFRPSKSPINDNYNKKDTFIKNIKRKVEKNKKKIKNINNKQNKKKLNKNKRYIRSNKYLTLKNSMNLTSYKTTILKNSKSISYLRTRNNSDIHLKVNLTNKSYKNIIHQKRINKKSKKKFNNLLFYENTYSKSKSPKKDLLDNNIKK